MGEMTLGKLITYILIFLFLGLFIHSMYSSNGFFNKLAKSVLGADKFISMEPSSEVKATPLPENIIQGRDSILSSLELAQNQQKINCILPQSLDLLKLGDYAGELIQTTETEVTLTILDPKNTGYVQFASETKPNIKLCIINPQPFYDCFLKENSRCPKTLEPTYYTKQSRYRISKDTTMKYLIKTPTGEVCIFPMEKTTFLSCNVRSTGLDESCENKIVQMLSSCANVAQGQITTPST